MLEKLLNKSDGQVKVDVLLHALIKLEGSMPGAATRNPRAALKKTISFLKAHEGKSIDALASALAEQKAKAPARKSAPALRKAVVEEHLNSLSRAESSPGEFARALEQLKGDKKVRAVELAEIVKAYTGSTAKPKNKTEGFRVIEHAFDRRWKLKNR